MSRLKLILLLAVVINLAALWGGTAVAGELTESERNYIDKHREIVFISQTAYPPFEFVDDSGRQDGMCHELIHWIAAEMGFKARFCHTTFEKAQTAVCNGSADVLTSFFHSEKRDRLFDFTPVMFLVPATIFVSADRPDIKSLSDLDGKRIASQAGDYALDFLRENGINFIPVLTKSFAEATNALVAGKADATIGDEQIILYHVYAHGLRKLVKKVGEPLYVGKNCMAVKEGHRPLLGILTKGIELARSRGVLDRLNRKWLGERLAEPRASFFVRYQKAIFILGVGMAVAGILAWAWIVNLRRQVAGRTRELNDSLSKYRELFENAAMGIFLADEKPIIFDANPRATEITGFTREELCRFKAGEIIHPSSLLENPMAAVRKRSLEEGVVVFERLYRTKGGKPVPVEINLIVSPQTGYHTVMFQDISDRKRAESSRRKSESTYRRLVENLGSRFCLFRHDLNGKMTYSSPSSEKFTGVAADEVIGKNWREAVKWLPGMVAAAEANSKGVVHGEKPYCTTELGFRDAKGNIRYIEATSHAQLDENGACVGLEGIFMDITERKNADEALRKSEAHLSAIFRAAPIGISVMEGRNFSYVNERYTEMVGYAEEELVGNSSQMLLADEEEFDRVGRELAGQIAEQGFGSVETLIRHKDGHPINILVNSAYLNPDDTNGPRSSIVMDITEWKKAERGLKQYQEELETMVKERTEELSTTVRELKRRNEEAQAMSHLGDLLQACETEQESFSIVSALCGQLFPLHAGFLGLYDHGMDAVRKVAVFGDYQGGDQDFGLGDCWALRRGSRHLVVDPARAPVCPHNADAPQMSSLCVPIMAKGELLGLFHLQCGLEGKSTRECALEMDDIGLLAKRLAELYALSLSNIRLRARLRHQSIRDALTGLYNRRHMEESLRREIARAARRNTEVGIILLDVDNFKRFNDQYGHEAGDEVLRRLGAYLMETTRGEDIACRYGGEEMLIIMPECDSKNALRRAEDIRAGIERLAIFHNGLKLSVTASFGVAVFPEQGDRVEALVAAADSALYLAKKNGRNRVEKLQA